MFDVLARKAGHSADAVPDAVENRLSASRGSGWAGAERLLAISGVVLIAARLNVWHLVNAGDLLALATAPVWMGELRRYVGARLIVGLGLATVPAGLALSVIATADHEVRRGTFVDTTSLMICMLACVGFLLWARGRLPVSLIAVLFGLGTLMGISSSAGLYTTNPWRFGYSVPVTVLALGLTFALRRRVLDLLVVATLMVVSALNDARSSFAILLLTLILLLWQMRPVARSFRASATRAVLGMGMIAVVVYNLGVALILSGVMGVTTQQRSIEQIDTSGSLIVGGRPEITATLALMRDRVIGFGSGTLPNYHDVMVVKQAMSGINFDPDNGYVERAMLGRGFALHSIFGDLWSQAGLVGLAFVAVLTGVVLHRLGHEIAHKTASALFIYLSVKTLWNVLFAPWYSSISIATLLLALCLVERSRGDRVVGAPPAVLRRRR